MRALEPFVVTALPSDHNCRRSSSISCGPVWCGVVVTPYERSQLRCRSTLNGGFTVSRELGAGVCQSTLYDVLFFFLLFLPNESV